MNFSGRIFGLVCLALVSTLAGGSNVAHALTVDNTSANNAITNNDGAYIDGTVVDNQPTFAQEIGTSASLTGTIALGDIPVSSGFFVFYFDAQETGGNLPIDITDITLEVGGGTIWDYNDGDNGAI